MTRGSLKALFGLGFVAAMTAAAWEAYAWRVDAELSASIHDHRFHKVTVQGTGTCNAEVAVYFQAPAGGYNHAEKGRNFYQFRAKVELSEQRVVLSPTFSNDQPGQRRFRFTHDTSSEGCWAKQAPKIFHLDVEGCRNRNCKVEPFR